MDQGFSALEIVMLVFGCVLALLVLVGGFGLMDKFDSSDKGLDRRGQLLLLAEVTAEAHSQGAEAQRAIEELRALAPHLKKKDWAAFEKQYQETLEAFSNGTGQVDAQMAHLEQLFRRDRIIGQARREIRGK